MKSLPASCSSPPMLPAPPSPPPPPPSPEMPLSMQQCRGFDIVRQDLNVNDMITQMFELSVSVTLMCDERVWSPSLITDSSGTHPVGWAPANYPCYDMASGTFGDFVADGSVNLFDVALLSRLVFGAGEHYINRATAYMRDPAAWMYNFSTDMGSTCQARSQRGRALSSGGLLHDGASIARTWSYACSSQDVYQQGGIQCDYDCIVGEDAQCMVAIAPVEQAVVSGGTWYLIPLPKPWVAVQLLLTEKFSSSDCALPGPAPSQPNALRPGGQKKRKQEGDFAT